MKRSMVLVTGTEVVPISWCLIPALSLIGRPRRTLDCRHGGAALAAPPGARRREYRFLDRRAGHPLRRSAMETLHRRCAGLDVHQKEIVACRRLVSGQKARSELARFPTTTRGLVDLSTWLSEAKVTHVAMEATGVYWKPVGRYSAMTSI